MWQERRSSDLESRRARGCSVLFGRVMIGAGVESSAQHLSRGCRVYRNKEPLFLSNDCIQLFFSFHVAEFCPLGCDNESYCVARPARNHWEYACLCREGYMGDRCELRSLPDFASSAVMLSNLAIVPAVFWAAELRDFLASAAFLSTGIASLFYHVCYSEHWCILPPHSLSMLDHAGCLCSFVSVVIRLMHFETEKTQQR